MRLWIEREGAWEGKLEEPTEEEVTQWFEDRGHQVMRFLSEDQTVIWLSEYNETLKRLGQAE